MTLISFIDRPAARVERGGDDAMCTTVSTSARAMTLRDDRVADVGPHELGAAEVGRGRHDVDADDPVDRRGQPCSSAREPAAEVAATPR